MTRAFRPVKARLGSQICLRPLSVGSPDANHRIGMFTAIFSTLTNRLPRPGSRVSQVLRFCTCVTLALTAFISPLNSQAAGTLLIPLSSTAKRPAADLIYRGQRIDPSAAMGLARTNIPLWQLDPESSELWSAQPQDPNVGERTLPAEGSTLRFDSFKASIASPRMFRAAVDGIDPLTQHLREYTLTVSLNNAASVIRAALLRRIGYRVDAPRVYERLTLSFDQLQDRDRFLQEMAERSTTSRDRWLVSQSDSPPQVTLRGVMLELGRPTNQAVHLGIMLPSLQRERRIFRSLLVPNLVLDLPEVLNTFSWEIGRIFNQSVWLDTYQADSFPDVTIDDLRWIVARLARLSRQDWASAVSLAHLPSDIAALVTEKVISRHNSLVRLLGLSEFSTLPIQPLLSIGCVERGQVARDPDADSPYHFYASPALAPLRFSQMWRFFLSETISAAMGGGLAYVNSSLLSPQTDSSAANRHGERVSQGIDDYIFRTGGIQGLNQPVGVWAAPTLGTGINASRNVIAGTVLGSDSQVQLVDQFSMSVNAGMVIGLDGLAPYVSPSVTGGVTLSRTFSHIKPIGDVNEALRANWTRLLVPEFMRGLSIVLNPQLQCSLSERTWTTTFVLEGKTFTRVNYDSATPSAREEATQLRSQLIAQGTPEELVLLTAVDRAGECEKEKEKNVNEALEEFANRLGTGEQFMITDSIRGSASAGVGFTPFPVVNGLNASARGEASEEVARVTTIRKARDGFEFYLQDRRLDQLQIAFDLNFYLNLFNYTSGVRRGNATTKFYQIKTEGANTETKLHLIRALKSLLRTNSAEILTDHFEPYQLFHRLFARFSRLRFLFWGRDRLTQDHQLTVYPPSDHPQENGRHFLMERNVLRTGKDIFGFVTSALRPFTGGATLGGSSGASDPGNAPGGRSFTSSISTQAEVVLPASERLPEGQAVGQTQGQFTRPVTLIEQTYRGWSIPRSGLFALFSAIENRFGALNARLRRSQGLTRGFFNRDAFHQAQTIQLYQVDSTLVVYPQALTQTLHAVFERLQGQPAPESANSLVRFEPNSSWVAFCPPNTASAGPPELQCNATWLNYVIWLRNRGLPIGHKNTLIWYNNLFVYLLNHGLLDDYLAALDPEHFFFVTRASGFMRGDNNGGLLYLSDSIGRFEGERGMGLYRELSTFSGVSLFELYARFFTDGL
jgi:hypothetical protein